VAVVRDEKQRRLLLAALITPATRHQAHDTKLVCVLQARSAQRAARSAHLEAQDAQHEVCGDGGALAG
jgi:hypothetical protein